MDKETYEMLDEALGKIYEGFGFLESAMRQMKTTISRAHIGTTWERTEFDKLSKALTPMIEQLEENFNTLSDFSDTTMDYIYDRIYM